MNNQIFRTSCFKPSLLLPLLSIFLIFFSLQGSVTLAASNPNPTLPLEYALYRINCGQDGARYLEEEGEWIMLGYKDKEGKVWADDNYFTASNTTFFDNLTYAEPHPYGIEATHDPNILLKSRWSTSSFSYTFPNVDSGRYLVRLYWAELDNNNFILFDGYVNKMLKGVGVRVFSVSANGMLKIPKVDIFQSVGPYAQLVREFWVEVRDEGSIKLDFNKLIGSPMIQGIEIIAESRVVPQQVLATGVQQGLLTFFYNYSDYPESPIKTMPDKGNFSKPISYVEISNYFSNPNNLGRFRSSPFIDQFAMQSSGFLRIPVAGKYKITLESNDGSQMWIWTDQQKQEPPQYIDNDGNHRNIQKYTNVTFAAPGFYPIHLKYFQGLVYSCLRLYWMTPSDDQSLFSLGRNVGRIIGPEYFSFDQSELLEVISSHVNGTEGLTLNGVSTSFIYSPILCFLLWAITILFQL